jgi:hypothetical protein
VGLRFEGGGEPFRLGGGECRGEPVGLRSKGGVEDDVLRLGGFTSPLQGEQPAPKKVALASAASVSHPEPALPPAAAGASPASASTPLARTDHTGIR